MVDKTAAKTMRGAQNGREGLRYSQALSAKGRFRRKTPVFGKEKKIFLAEAVVGAKIVENGRKCWNCKVLDFHRLLGKKPRFFTALVEACFFHRKVFLSPREMWKKKA